MAIDVLVYAVTRGQYNSAIGFPELFKIELGSPVAVTLDTEGNAIDFKDLGATSLTVGDDEQGPIVDIEFRELTRTVNDETVAYAFARLETENAATFFLLAIDASTGELVDANLPETNDYTIGSTFDAIEIGPLENTPPAATDDSATLDEDSSVSIDVLANDTDVEGDTLTITALGDPSKGTVEVVDGEVVYTADADATGDDSFSYTVSDGEETDSGTVSLTISPVNDAPVATDDSATLDEDSSVSIDVLANDSDVEGDTLTITALGDPSKGTVEVVDGEVVYTADADATGDDSFSYTVSDGEETDSGTVSLTISPVNDAPVATDDSATLDEDSSVSIDVLANDSDVEGDTLTITALGDPSKGTVEVVDGEVVYTADADATGDDSFSYTVSDGEETDSGTVSLTISPVNDAPVATDDSATLDEDSSVSIDVLANDSDVEGDTLTITALGDPSKGTVEVVDGEVVYTADADATGDDSFSYTVSDGEETDSGTVSLTITPVNDAPVATDDSATLDEDSSVSIDVLANDSDVEGDTLTITALGTPGSGAVQIVDGKIEYTPDANFSGTDLFSYTVSDGEKTSSAEVTLTVTDVPDEIDGGEGDETFTPGAGVETYRLGGGQDTVKGPVQNFFGDTYEDFSKDDEIVFDEAIGRDRMSVTEGSAIIAIDTDGDGSSDGSFTLTGDFTDGDFMAVIGGAETTLTFEEFLPILAERQAVDPDLVNGIINQAFLTGNGMQDMAITLKDMGFAVKDNVLGAYEINDSGEIVDTKILFANANQDKTASTVLNGVEEGHQIGFFLIQDGADWLAAQDAGAELSFVNAEGEAASVDDGVLSLALNGQATDQIVFHSFDSTFNVDGIEHTLSGVDAGGESLTVGFEDLVGGGDRDFEDVVFSVAFIDVPLA